MVTQSFTGGLRTRWFNATWPLARMTLTDEGVVIRVFGLTNTRSSWRAAELT